jgi:hypothetical protein
MKAERRHELRENDLVHAMEVGRDYLRDNGGRVGVVCLVVIVAAVAISFGVRSQEAAHADIFRRMDGLAFNDVETGRQSLDTLTSLIAESNDEGFALKGLLQQGRQALRLAQEVPFPPDLDLNEQAQSAFQILRTRFPDNPLATGVALNGLATVEENRFAYDEDVSHKEKARGYLTAIVEDASLNGLAFQRIALDRLDALEGTFTVVTLAAPTLTPEELEELEAQAAEDVADETGDGETDAADEGDVD